MTTRIVRRAKVAAAAAAGVVGLLSAGPAFAAGTVTVTPNPIPAPGAAGNVTVTVNYSGFTPNKRLFLSQCNTPQSSKTNFGYDCSALSEIPVNYGLNPTGTGSVSFPVFYGPEPSGDWTWGCWTPTDTPDAGYDWFNQADKGCYIRVVTDTESNNADAATARITFAAQETTTTTVPPTTAPPTTAPNTDVPEAPVAVLLPLAALVAAGGAAGFVVLQRRKNAHTA